MNTEQAIKECERWFAHLDRGREKARRLQELAALARTGPDGHAEAKKQLRQIDNTPQVYNGDRLEEAVNQLIRAVSREVDGQ